MERKSKLPMKTKNSSSKNGKFMLIQHQRILCGKKPKINIPHQETIQPLHPRRIHLPLKAC